MNQIIDITTEAQLAEVVSQATAPFEIISLGTKRGFGRPVESTQQLSLRSLAGVTAYEPAELVLDAKPATPMAEIAALLASQSQELAFEPPDLGPLLGAGPGSLAGAIACNLAGPRRIKAGAARDHLLGLTAVSGRGEIFKAGGRVVKNVTGYDLCKLVAGSFGTLALMTSLSVKVLPAAEKTRTLLLPGRDMAAAWEAMTKALSSGHEISGAAFLPAKLTSVFGEARLGKDVSVTALRVEGPARSVEERCAALRKLVGGTAEELHTTNSRAFWQKLRDVAPFVGDGRAVWRVSVPPQNGPALAAAVAAMAGADLFFDWGGGLAWVAVPDTGDAEAGRLRAAIGGHGHATLVRASAATRRAVSPFQPLAPAVAALEGRIKQVFDPKGLFNPGRMWPVG